MLLILLILILVALIGWMIDRRHLRTKSGWNDREIRSRFRRGG
jgi:hypothetical protein